MSNQKLTLIDKVIKFCLENKLVVAILLAFIILWGVMVAPFDWDIGGLPRNPVPVDAIPDIGENQQIVFTKWMGRSPQDVEDQISYPLTVALLGVPGVKTIRSYSMFGFSTIYIIFKEKIDFYWSRSRIIEKLNSLPAGTLPPGTSPALGPDATSLGQIFWYTLEGRDKDGNPTGGWDPHELRSIQDWYVRYALLSADGVAEVGSVGGFVQEYQIDVDPDAMRAYGVALEDVFKSVKMSNIDVGAKTIEVNKVEYMIRGIGFIKSIKDIENSVIKSNNNVPVYIKNVAHVTLGPALRRGALDKDGVEVTGGVVVTRYGENPLKVIKNVKKKIKEISAGLPSKTLDDGTVSKVTVIPFYDRSGLIYETLGTLNTALTEEILVTMIVVIVMVLHLRSSILISGLLPVTVLGCFILMKLFKVEANIVALSGIAIAIGTIVDMGVVVCENILKHLEIMKPEEKAIDVIFRACSEVGGAVVTAVSTTIISFLPVFTMEAAEGKLFKPLAYTKTFALFLSVVVALTIIPPFAHILFTARKKNKNKKSSLSKYYSGLLIIAGFIMLWFYKYIGLALLAFGLHLILKKYIPEKIKKILVLISNYIIVLIIAWILSSHWLPLGPERGFLRNYIFVTLTIGGILFLLILLQKIYEPLLRICLNFKVLFLTVSVIIVLFGGVIWLGFGRMFTPAEKFLNKIGVSSESLNQVSLISSLKHEFPGLGKEFMPDLDEGSYLYMPTTMPHASIGESLDVLHKLDMQISSIPEIESAVGKLGRAETPLDPAPISMIETVINYKSEYVLNKDGSRATFKYDDAKQEFVKDSYGELVPDKNGRPFRQWRDHIRKPGDIWKEIVKKAKIPGTTSAPKLQPISARIVMLQSGMRAPMGIKIKGPDLVTIEKVGLELEKFMKEVPSVEASAVNADRIVGKPYLEINIDREAIARYGMKLKKVQMIIEVAIGGMKLDNTVEGRERYPIRVRYQRELRDSIEQLGRILVPGMGGVQIPLIQLAEIKYVRGPQVIKSEDTFLTGYVLFDKKPGYAEVDVVEAAQKYLKAKQETGELVIPAGVNYTFAGSYENQVRSEKKLMIVLPLALFVIFMILYFQFKSVPTTMLVFSGIFVAWAGGFLMIWLYGQDWFLNFNVFDVNMRDLFSIKAYNLSVAVWVGFLALFGIASDNGVILATYAKQIFDEKKPGTVKEIRDAIVLAGNKRIRPCLMTTATTILALIPVLTSTGRGSDILVPMAIPSFGGMTVVLITVFLIPVLYSLIEEIKLKFKEDN